MHGTDGDDRSAWQRRYDDSLARRRAEFEAQGGSTRAAGLFALDVLGCLGLPGVVGALVVTGVAAWRTARRER